MGIDVHDVSEGDILVFRAGTAYDTIGAVVATTGCTIWVQPLGARAQPPKADDDTLIELREDLTYDIVQIQGSDTVSRIFDSDDIAGGGDGVWRIRGSLLRAVALLPGWDQGSSVLNGS
jgi:hypothetical protein